MPPNGLALHTDFYEITMSAVYHARGMNQSATFSLFAHDLPVQRGYMIAAGLEAALDYLENFAFTQEDIDYLRSLARFDDDFLQRLAEVRFTGDVWAMPEGTVCFAEEPILEVTAPIIEAQDGATFSLFISQTKQVGFDLSVRPQPAPYLFGHYQGFFAGREFKGGMTIIGDQLVG